MIRSRMEHDIRCAEILKTIRENFLEGMGWDAANYNDEELDSEFNSFFYELKGDASLREKQFYQFGPLKVWAEAEYGGADKGSKYWVVLGVEENGVISFWKVPGWYSSYDGPELEPGNMFEVKEEEEVIKVWNRK